MTNIRFSILLASRQRLDLLHGLLTSLQETTTCPAMIEVLVVIDSDDDTYDISSLEEKYAQINLKFYVRERSDWMHKHYINWVYKKSFGKYVIVLNDDTKFIAPGWDDKSWLTLETYLTDKPDGVVMGYTENMVDCCPFPLFSRCGVDALGFVMPEELKSWSGDHSILIIYNHPTVNRKINLPDLKIQHISIHTKSRARDEISFRMETLWMTQHNVFIPYDCYINKLSNYISKFNNQLTITSPQITCIAVNPSELAIQSIVNQSLTDWELIVIGQTKIVDSRIKLVTLEENSMSWRFNRAFRQNLGKGFFITYLCNHDLFYPNAFATFVRFFQDHPHAKVVYASQDLVIHHDDLKLWAGENRAIPKPDSQLNCLQFCHRRDITNLISGDLWTESKIVEKYAPNIFLDNLRQVTTVYPLDIKIGQTVKVLQGNYDSNIETIW